MKRLKFILICMSIVLCAAELSAQKLVLGEKTPELKVKEWVGAALSDNSNRLVQFVNAGSINALELNRIAGVFDSRMNVIVVVNGQKSEVAKELSTCSPKFYVAVDNGGKISASYGVQFLPYCVLIDGKGRALWFGNPSQLNDQMIEKLLK